MLAGGGSNSPAWCQILANVIGCNMSVPAGMQFEALGAALTGAVGVGLFDGYEEAVKGWVKIEHTYEPNLESHQKYDEAYKLYRDLISSMSSFWKARQEMLDQWNS